MKTTARVEEMLDTKAAGEIIGKSVYALYEMAMTGRLKSYRKPGKRYLYFKKSDLDEYKTFGESYEQVEPVLACRRKKTGKEYGLTSVRGQLLSVEEAASFMGMSGRWVRKHMKNNTFPVKWYAIGPRCRVIDSADLDDYFKKTGIESSPLAVRIHRRKKKGGDAV